MSRTAAKFLDYDGLVQYTGKVKKAINDAVGATTDENVKQTKDTSGSTALPVVLANAADPNGAAAQVKYDTAMTYKPSTDELKVESGSDSVSVTPTTVTVANGSNITTIKKNEVKITDGTNTTTITPSSITLPSGAKPSVTYTKSTGKLNVTVGGQTSTDASLAVADASNYGVVKVDSALSDSSTNPVQNKVAKGAIDAAAKTVKQTEKSDAMEYNLLMTDISTSATNDEVEYSSLVTHNPGNKSTTFNTSTGTSTNRKTHKVVIEGKGITLTNNVGLVTETEAALSATNYGGHADATETALASTTSGSEGADMVGYGTKTENNETVDVTVKDALDELYQTVGGSGGTSLSTRVTNLEQGTNLNAANGNVTIAYNSTSGKVDISTLDQKVSQTADTSTNGNVPILLASGTTPSSPAGAKYRDNVTVNPSTGAVVITKPTNNGLADTVTISNSAITFHSADAGATDVTLTHGNYGGTAAKATADGNGNNIVNTYATKSALSELSQKWTGQFHIAQSLPTLSNTGTSATDEAANQQYLGYIYLLKDEEHGDTNSNIFNEYICVYDSDASSNKWKWELIGTTDAGVDVVSLTESEINTIWSTTAAAS